MKFPLQTIHQIEITSRCNLRCRYCTSPNLQRNKMDMAPETYIKALEMVRHLMKKRTQKLELNLAGIGESTMHPHFCEYLMMARDYCGARMDILFATNGLTFTREIAKACQTNRIGVFVSLHRPEKAAPAINLAREYGVYRKSSTEPATAAVDWAGQVNWKVTAPKMKCDWITNGWAMVMADGRLTSCSMDASGIGVFGHVDNDPDQLFTKPYGLCKNCHMDLDIPGYTQRAHDHFDHTQAD